MLQQAARRELPRTSPLGKETCPVRIAVNGTTALRIVRAARRSGTLGSMRRVDLPAPDPSPHRRWYAHNLPLARLGLSEPPSTQHKLHVAVPSAAQRIQGSFADCTVYTRGLPPNAFLDAGDGVCVAGPELLFLELTGCMSAPVHVLLGFELCGTYARDPVSPRTGEVEFGARPATSVARLREFAEKSRYRDAELALEHLSYVADNAWSPMEAVVAAMASLPVTEFGYGMGRVSLNARRANDGYLVARGCPESRVPDIEVVGARVGFNYDGRGHLDLDSISCAQDAGEALGAIAAVREKYVDDLRRNRELAASGVVTLPVTSEDLFAEGGLDVVMYETTKVMELMGQPVSDFTRGSLASRTMAARRQKLLWSVLPWSEAPALARDLLERERRELSGGTVEEATVVL